MNSQPASPQENYDAIIIGGGPAGASVGTVLAEKGRNVLILEKDNFPRYHVGESLMPHCYFAFERLGILEDIKKSPYTKKYSVQFVTEEGKISKPFYFFQHTDHDSSTTWQVERKTFDPLLLNKARSKGATVKEGAKVTGLIKENDRITGVEVESSDSQPPETYFAKVVVDASGRDAFSAGRATQRLRDPMLKKVALWTYFEDAVLDPGLDAGSTTVAYLPERGWFWYIPLHNGQVSVGIVAEKDYLYANGTKDPAEIFQREINNNAWIKEHLAPAKQVGKYHVTGDYSYRSETCAQDGLVLVGDAFAFLDPVFSSGLYLALVSGVKAGDAINEALNDSAVTAEHFEEYGQWLCHGMENMRKLVYAFYDPEFSFGKLMKKRPDLRPDLTDCLIGDLFDRNFDDLFGEIEQMANIPPELSYGRAKKESLTAS